MVKLLVSLTGPAEAQADAWVASLLRLQGVTVERMTDTLPLPTFPTAPIAGPAATVPTVAVPTSATMPGAPFANGRVYAAKNGNGFRCFDQAAGVTWLYNDRTGTDVHGRPLAAWT